MRRLRGQPDPWVRPLSGFFITILRRGVHGGARAANETRPPVFELRPYQRELLEEAEDKVRHEGANRLLFSVATGLGKTAIFANLPRIFPRHHKHGTMILVHRDELVQQARSALLSWGPSLRVAIEQGRHHTVPDPSKVDVVIASVQTLGRSGPSSKARLSRYKGWGGILIVDEAHHLKVDSTYDAILSGMGLGGRRKARVRGDTGQQGEMKKVVSGKEKQSPPVLRRLLLGFTATPFRMDRASLGDFFDTSLKDHNLTWGIREGWLVDIVVHRVRTLVDLDQVPQRLGDLAITSLDKAVNVEDRNLAAVKAIKEHGGRQAIVFCASVAHAHALAAKLEENGIRAEAVYGEMAKEERQEVLGHFRSGSIAVLTNFNVLTEGFDAPACDTIVMARPTLSPGLYLQMIGRGTRPVVHLPPESTIPDRLHAIEASSKPRMRLVDLVDNCTRHKVVSLPVLLGLRSDFDMGRDTTVGQIATEVEDVWAEVGDGDEERAVLERLLSDARSVEDLRLKVQQYRLMDGRRGTSSTAPPPARVLALSPTGPLPLPDDRIMGRERTSSQHSGHRVFATHFVRVASMDHEGLKVLVRMKDVLDRVFEWNTSRVRDADKEEIYVGSYYLLDGTIKAAHAGGSQPPLVEVTRAVMYPVDARDDIDNLRQASKQVLEGRLPVETWLEHVWSHLRRRQQGAGADRRSTKTNDDQGSSHPLHVLARRKRVTR